MSDVVVTVQSRFWDKWLEEGGLPGERSNGTEYGFSVRSKPNIEVGERVYIVAGNKLRGYAPLVRVGHAEIFATRGNYYRGQYALVRQGGAVAVTIDEPIKGFQGYRYRWWDRDDEKSFRDWQVL